MLIYSTLAVVNWHELSMQIKENVMQNLSHKHHSQLE